MTLRFTSAGTAALADGTARATRAVQIRSIVVGTGRGAGDATDDSRTALRAQRASVDVTGSTIVSGRIAVQADIIGATDYDVTELGITARIGSDGAPFLLAYDAVPAGDDPIIRVSTGVTTTIGVVIEVTHAVAEVTVTIAPTLALAVGLSRTELDTRLGGASTTVRSLVELATPEETRAGTDGTRAVTPEGLSSVLPPGMLMPYAGASVPAGWLLCDGRAVSRTTYARLFASVGTRWGAGDGRTTFALPDLRRRVAVGSGGAGTTALGAEVGSTGGAESHRLAAAELPSHSHTDGTLAAASAGSHKHDLGGTASMASAGGHSHADGTLAAASAGGHHHADGGTLTARSGGAHTHQLLVQGDDPPTASRRALDADNVLSTEHNTDWGRTRSGGAHTHAVTGRTGSAGRHTHDVSGRTAVVGGHTHAVTGRTWYDGAHVHDVTGHTGRTGGGAAHPLLQPSAVIHYLIRA